MSQIKSVTVFYNDGTSDRWEYPDSVRVYEGVLQIWWDYNAQPWQRIPLTSIKRWEEQ